MFWDTECSYLSLFADPESGFLVFWDTEDLTQLALYVADLLKAVKLLGVVLHYPTEWTQQTHVEHLLVLEVQVSSIQLWRERFLRIDTWDLTRKSF